MALPSLRGLPLRARGAWLPRQRASSARGSPRLAARASGGGVMTSLTLCLLRQGELRALGGGASRPSGALLPWPASASPPPPPRGGAAGPPPPPPGVLTPLSALLRRSFCRSLLVATCARQLPRQRAESWRGVAEATQPCARARSDLLPCQLCSLPNLLEEDSLQRRLVSGVAFLHCSSPSRG